jgi:DNA-binding transcriptional MerR regulator
MSTHRYFDVKAASKFSGLSRFMVDYLCRSAVLVPTGRAKPGRGRSRQYVFGDVVMLRVLGQLLSCGISVAKLKKALQLIRKRHGEITAESLPGNYLLTDGSRLYFKDSHDALEELAASGQLAFAFVLKLGQIRDEVAEAVESSDTRRVRAQRRSA